MAIGDDQRQHPELSVWERPSNMPERQQCQKRTKKRKRSFVFLMLVSTSLILYCCCLLQTTQVDARPHKWRLFKKKKKQGHMSVPPKQQYHSSSENSSLFSNISLLTKRFWYGLWDVFATHPSLILSVGIRIVIAIWLELLLDGFLKTVVTPALASTGIGALVAPMSFLIGQALQPMIHSIAFLVFDDRFLLKTLEATGIQEQLIQNIERNDKGSEIGWHKITLAEGMMTRYVMKSMAAWCLGWAGLCTIVPVVGHVLTAVLSGWVVAWDYVYVPLAGMGYLGPWQQLQTVWQHFGAYGWYGFWAVLIEEIPLIGPVCHVYNVYSAAFFLERLYILHKDTMIDDDAATVSTVDSDYSWNSQEL
jgi:hypothetical protein